MSRSRWWRASKRITSTANPPTRSWRRAAGGAGPPSRGAEAQQAPESPRARTGAGGGDGRPIGPVFGSTGPRGGRHEGLAESAARSAVRTVGSAVGREIVRGVLGSIFGGGSKRRR
jgi:hypothetical protein